MTRRHFLHGLAALTFGFCFPVAFLNAGCAQRAPKVSVADVVALTGYTLLNAVAGPPDNARGALPSQPADTSLLAKGVYETVIISADTEGFARVSKGALTERDLETIAVQVTAGVNKELKERGFSARLASYPADTAALAASPDKPLLAVLTPTTEDGGSPQDRAQGKNPTFVKVLLTITDPKTGALLRQREFYSGANVKKP